MSHIQTPLPEQCLMASRPSPLDRRRFIQGAGAVAIGAGIAASGAHHAYADALSDTAAIVSSDVTVPGFGGDVTVSLSVDTKNGTVQDVKIEGPWETPRRGSVAIEKMQAAMNESGSIEVDLVSSATVTSTAIIDAARHAYCTALGTSVTKPEMVPGTYEASSYGFYAGLPVTVRITVDKDAVNSIEVVGDNLEHVFMLRAVEETYIPRLLEAQSLCVDAVTGATMTSSAVRLATENCIKQAYAQAGFGDDAVYGWLTTAEAPQADPVSYDVDVVVVGLGGAGMMAALAAAERGLSVVAIEKAGRYGGTTCVTSESMAVNPSTFQDEQNGGKDYIDVSALKEDWWARVNQQAKETMVDLFIAESGNTIDWLAYEHEWPYNTPGVGHADYAVYNCCFQYTPYTLSGRKVELGKRIDGIMKQFTDLGGTYLLETDAQEFIVDEATGTVAGVKAIVRGKQECTVHAKAVVLATGGYGENIALMNRFMIDDYYPLSGTWHLYGMYTNTGTMIEQALDLGAGTFNPSVPPLAHLSGFPVNLYGFEKHTKDEDSFFTGYTAIWSEGDIPHTLSVAADALAVTRLGERFMNEEEFIHAGGIKAGPEYYTIWSQAQLDTFKAVGLSYADLGPSMGYLGCCSTIPLGVPLGEMDNVIEAALATGYAHKADSIEELAAIANMDPQTLRATVDAYNDCCASGTDADYGKDPRYLVAVDGGPYYALLACNYYYTTGGALDVNEDLQVLSSDGATPIEGLYAVGTDSMGVLMTNENQYLDYGGAASGWAFTSGRLVGATLAERLI